MVEVKGVRITAFSPVLVRMVSAQRTQIAGEISEMYPLPKTQGWIMVKTAIPTATQALWSITDNVIHASAIATRGAASRSSNWWTAVWLLISSVHRSHGALRVS